MPVVLYHSLLVGAGGFVGSVTRYSMTLLFQRWDLHWPLGTMASNWLGCFVIGMIAELSASFPGLQPEARLLLATGFCGGFTTLSSLIYECAKFVEDGEYAHAGLYLAVTLIGAVALFLAGLLVTRGLKLWGGAIWN